MVLASFYHICVVGVSAFSQKERYPMASSPTLQRPPHLGTTNNHHKTRSAGLRFWQIFVGTALAILMATTLVLADNNNSALSAITGRVVDKQGQPVSGATITVKNPQTGLSQNLATNAQGLFQFENLVGGDYQVSIVAKGFSLNPQAVSLVAGNATNLELVVAASDNSANLADEVIQLRHQLAETGEQVAKLTVMVQDLQAKLNNSQPNIATASRANLNANTNIAPSTPSPYTPATQPQEPTPQKTTSTIDTLIAPKLAGGQFSGSSGLIKTDRLKIGGYVDFRYQTRGIDDAFEIRSNADEANPGMTDLTNFKRNTFTTPRFIVGFATAITDKLLFNSELEFEFAGKETEVEQAYLEYRFNPKFNIRGGVLVPPLGRFNTFHDANLQDISNRPLVSTFVIPSTYKDAGIGILGEFNIGSRAKLTYEGYVVNGLRSDEGGEFTREAGLFESKGNNRFFDNNPQKSFVGRLGFSPFLGLEAGFSGYRGKHDNQGQYDLSIFAIDYKFTKGNFQVQGEYARAAIQRAPESPEEIAAKHFLQSLPKGDYINTFQFLDENINEPIFDKSARSTDGFYIETRYRFRPKWFTSRTTDDASIAPVFRYDQVNLDRSYPSFSFPLNMRRYSAGISIRPTEAASFNFIYNKDRKPNVFLRLPDGRPFPPYYTNLGVSSFSFGMSYAF